MRERVHISNIDFLALYNYCNRILGFAIHPHRLNPCNPYTFILPFLSWFSKWIFSKTFPVKIVEVYYIRRNWRNSPSYYLVYIEGYIYRDLSLHVGGGLEYLHRSPASRKRRHKGNAVPGGTTGGYKYGKLAFQVWGISDETVKYGFGFWTTQTIEWLHRKLQTRPLVREDAP
jgi:hypothetical protein